MDRAHAVATASIEAAKASGLWDLEADLEALNGRILADLGDNDGACDALARSLTLQEDHPMDTEESTIRYARTGMLYCMLGCPDRKTPFD